MDNGKAKLVVLLRNKRRSCSGVPLRSFLYMVHTITLIYFRNDKGISVQQHMEN